MIVFLRNFDSISKKNFTKLDVDENFVGKNSVINHINLFIYFSTLLSHMHMEWLFATKY